MHCQAHTHHLCQVWGLCFLSNIVELWLLDMETKGMDTFPTLALIIRLWQILLTFFSFWFLVFVLKFSFRYHGDLTHGVSHVHELYNCLNPQNPLSPYTCYRTQKSRGRSFCLHIDSSLETPINFTSCHIGKSLSHQAPGWPQQDR